MVLALDTLPRKTLTIALAVLLSAAMGYSLWRQYRAETLQRQGTRDALEQALELQPRNAEFHNRLGRIHLFSPDGNSDKAMSLLTRATQINERRASFWTDLALAFELRGDTGAAAQAFERARQVEPRTPQVLWQQLNFHLRREEYEQALILGRLLLEAAPEYSARLLPLLGRVTDDDTLIRRVVPASRDPLVALLEFLARERRPEPRSAELAWRRVVQQNAPMPAFAVRMFLDWLLNARQVALAERVWSDAAQRSWIAVPADSLEQTLYNADFRYPLLNFGFDWRVAPHPEATVLIEPEGPEPGQQSLCVQFYEDARAAYSNVSRLIAVESGSRYVLRAQVRSERLDARPGAFLEVQELTAPNSRHRRGVFRSDTWRGTTRWRPLSVEFITGPETSLVQLSLHRPAARAGDPAASGLLCVAAFDLKSLGAIQ
jgi:tetratricopeptide (TPR) repeat protein